MFEWVFLCFLFLCSMLTSRSYWNYFLRSKGRHGIHSPFVFDFVSTCLTTKLDKKFQQDKKKWISQLKQARDFFDVDDLGSGSKHLKKRRSIAQLVKTASSNGVYGEVLWKIAHHYQPKNMLELGTSVGVGTVHLKAGAPTSFLTTVEGCDNTLAKAYQQFDYWKLERVLPICSSFETFLALPTHSNYDLVFIDGHHSGEATLHYLDMLMRQTHNETIFIIDDIRWNDDMWKAWNEIVSNQTFHLTIDLGRMGICWKREQQTKEHFTIRPVIFNNRFV